MVYKTMSSVILDEKNNSNGSQCSENFVNLNSSETLPQANSCTMLISSSQKRLMKHKDNTKSRE